MTCMCESGLDMLKRVERMLDVTRALRARRWHMEWPPGHPETPHRKPDHVMYIEGKYGPGMSGVRAVIGDDPVQESEWR